MGFWEGRGHVVAAIRRKYPKHEIAAGEAEPCSEGKPNGRDERGNAGTSNVQEKCAASSRETYLERREKVDAQEPTLAVSRQPSQVPPAYQLLPFWLVEKACL
jgi:hypothetical protein